jgi:hypothetical protein
VLTPPVSVCEDHQVVPDSIHDFFLASGSAAGALIGLLFVAISVASERVAREKTGAQLYRVRASVALTAFTNALTVSLFALIPGHKIGPAVTVVAVGGLTFVAAAALWLIRLRQPLWDTLPHVLLLVGLAVVFVFQLVEGVDVITQPGDSGAVNTIAVLVVVCFLIGVARAWALIGGPSIGFVQEVIAFVQSHEHSTDDPADEEPR